MITADTTVLDSLSISPLNFQLYGLDGVDYSIDFADALLIIRDVKDIGKSVDVCYQSFVINLGKPYFHKNYSDYVLNGYSVSNPFIYRPEKENFSLIEKDGLQKMGSISRGVSFGNNQDLSVNSNLNLQLSGKVAEDVYVVAAITDDNIPIQPDGSTNQLQDFDKVFIQLYNDKNKLIVGDFQTKYEKGNYLRYFKKAQGGLYENRSQLLKSNGDSLGLLTSTVGASLSRGKYARNVFNGIEGNQGPYRLIGANNERFIIVLSGTETVFIDGKKLKRGQEFDYVIDYNTAEISFTANQLITKDKRIVVEYQYSDKNYARTIVQFNEEFISEKLTMRFNIFSEQDAKNQPLQQDLSDEQTTKLREVGDSLSLAYASSAISTSFTEDAVLYTMVDSLGVDSIFVFSTNPNDSLYRVAFSLVGDGLGNYIQSNSIANGKIFEWVQSGGSYEPFILLAAPEKRQMVDIELAYKISEATTVFVESAVSNKDINTFSVVNDEDDVGLAVNASVLNDKELSRSLNLRSNLFYESISSQFNFIERFREVEFDRDWNLRNKAIASSQNRGGISVQLQKENLGEISYSASTYNIQNDFVGFKNDFGIKSVNEYFSTDIKSSYLLSKGFGEKTEFFRVKSTIIKPLWLINLGLNNDFENNKRKNSVTNQLSNLSYSFNEWEAFIQTADSMQNNAKVSYGQRLDYSPSNGGFKDSTIGKNLSLELQMIKNRNHTLKTTATYRTLLLADTSIKGVKADSTILNRIEYGLRLFKGAIVTNTYYEIGSGLEIKKEFTFIKVPTGQGLYVHNDNNDNGLKELDEFELAPQNLLYSADYIKVFVPTSDYVKTYKNQFNQTIMLRPKAIWRTNKGVKGFVSRFTDQFAMKMDRKTNQKQAFATYNPLIINIADSVLVSQNKSFKNIISFNRSSPKFGIDFVVQNAANKTLLTSGFEERERSFYEIKPRWNITRKVLLKASYKNGTKRLSSDFFASRNYEIDFMNISPSITFQPNTTLRIEFDYKYMFKQNNSIAQEKVYTHKIGVKSKFNIAEKGALTAEANYFLIDYPYSTNSALSFEMLEGLSPGNNSTWFVSYQRTLANNLQISLTYNGRWSEDSPVVHVGGLQARAFF